jgi:tetrapyrrole methylase family protein / MazG family protein
MSAPRSPRHPITVLGLGPGDPRHLTEAARAVLAAAPAVWVRTLRHPACAALAATREVRSFDALYEGAASFGDVYRGIADALLAAALDGPVTYAVPGDPSMGEASVGLLRSMAPAAGSSLTVLPGVSFVEPTLAALGWDAFDGLQIADATALAARHYPDLDPDRPALVAQLYSRLLASDVKLLLLEAYPPEHPVILVAGAGDEDARSRTMPLAELDHGDYFDDVSTLAVPPRARPGSVLTLAEVVSRLRAPDGCPWDREQTHESLRPYLLEETYEVLEALDAGDDDALAEELGDLLLQIVLHAQLAAEDGAFALADIVRHIAEKIVRRHPHVFGSGRADTPDAVRGLWEQLKAGERADRGVPDDPFAGVPPALPALARARAVQGKAVSSGRVPSAAALRADAAVAASLARLGGASAPGDGPAPPDAADRVGRALWAVVAVADSWGVDAETALRETVLERQRQLQTPPSKE